MTGRERILAMLDGAPVDHLPAMPITMMFAADTAGIRYREYASDHRALAHAQVTTARLYGFDHVSVISDPARETADLGGTIEWFDDQPPAIVESQAILSDKQRLNHLSPPDLDRPGRMRDRIDGVAQLRREVGDSLLVEGWVEGPCAMAADLRGLSALMLDFSDDPEFVSSLFEFVVEMELQFAQAQIQAGADLIGVGDAASSLVGPRRFERFVFPYEQKLIAKIAKLGARVRLHICGNTRKVLPWMGQCHADLVDLDFLSPMEEARRSMGPSQTLLGNIDPVRVLRDGTVELVTNAIDHCYRAAAPRYIVGAGCEVPRGTPPENLHALIEFARGRAPT